MKRSFPLFGITLYPYTLLMIAGVVLCVGIYVIETHRRYRMKSEENLFALETLLVSAAIGFPAAILADAVFKWGETGLFSFQGATFYGGMLSVLAVWSVLLCIRRGREVSVYERLCCLAPGIPAGHCLGRLGCFFGGCCFGAPTNSVFGVVFPEGSLPYLYYGGDIAIHPTQLYEAGALLVVFVVLFFTRREWSLPLYFILYGMIRFGIEELRNDVRGRLFGLSLSPAQMISVCLIALGIGIFIWRAVRFSRQKAKTEE